MLKQEKQAVGYIVAYNGAEATPGAWSLVAKNELEALKNYGVEFLEAWIVLEGIPLPDPDAPSEEETVGGNPAEASNKISEQSSPPTSAIDSAKSRQIPISIPLYFSRSTSAVANRIQTSVPASINRKGCDTMINSVPHKNTG